MKLRRGNTVLFKMKNSYRHPMIKGTVENSSKSLVWIKIEEIKGKPAKEHTVVCVHKKNIY